MAPHLGQRNARQPTGRKSITKKMRHQTPTPKHAASLRRLQNSYSVKLRRIVQRREGRVGALISRRRRGALDEKRISAHGWPSRSGNPVPYSYCEPPRSGVFLENNVRRDQRPSDFLSSRSYPHDRYRAAATRAWCIAAPSARCVQTVARLPTGERHSASDRRSSRSTASNGDRAAERSRRFRVRLPAARRRWGRLTASCCTATLRRSIAGAGNATRWCGHSTSHHTFQSSSWDGAT